MCESNLFFVNCQRSTCNKKPVGWLHSDLFHDIVGKKLVETAVIWLLYYDSPASLEKYGLDHRGH